MENNINVVDVIIPNNIVEITTNVMDNVELVTLGPQGPIGPIGYTYTPSVDSSGILTWTNNGDLDNPDSYNLMSTVNAKLTNYVTKSDYNNTVVQSLSTIDLYKILI